MNKAILVTMGLMSIGLAGCQSDSDRNNTPTDNIDSELRALIDTHGLTGDPATGRQLPDISDPIAQLGKALFFTKALSGTLDTACVSCHHPMLGGGDALSLPVGVHADLPDVLGPGRTHSSAGTHFDGGPTVPRNSPTTFNLGLYDKAIFHDGRVESLTPVVGSNGTGTPIRTPDAAFGSEDSAAGGNLSVAQARFPVTSAEEMRGFDFDDLDNNGIRELLTERLRGVRNQDLATNQWAQAFADAFGDASADPDSVITFDRVVLALAEYERSQVFIESPWKAYVEGDNNALDSNAKRGAQLFFTATDAGGAGCVSCHSGDFFTDEQFHVLAIPQIGRGKGDGENGTDDFGRFRETGVEADRYAFRTPALLNTAISGPWGHSGAYTELEDVIKHHLDPRQAITNYDLNQLDAGIQVADMQVNTGAALNQLESLQAAGNSMLTPVALTDEEIDALVAFLNSLTDPCTQSRECLSPWIANDQDINPDGLQLRALDGTGQAL